MNRRSGSERGQVLIITAAVMIVLLGIAALVIDLGFSWMLRRQEQNAADPAALAAARFIGAPDAVTKIQPYDPLGNQAACFYAVQNGIFASTNPTCDPALDPDGARIEVKYPPDSSAGRFAGQNGAVQVIITKQRETFFSRIFGFERATVSTQAVALRQEGNANTHSLVALDPHGCPSATIHGNAYIHIYSATGVVDPGGYVHVESDCGTAFNGNDACSNGTGALKIDGTNANLFAPKTNVVGSCQTTQSDEPHGLLDEAASPIGDPFAGLRFPKPDASTPGETCGVMGPQTGPTGPAANGCGNNPMTWDAPPCPDDPLTPVDESDDFCVSLEPGVYYGGWKIGPKLRVILSPGIYVIAGGGITIGASGSLQSVIGGSGPAPVLIFNTDNPAKAGCPINNNAGCQQQLDITAGASLALAGLLDNAACYPVTPMTATDCPYAGMVIWYDGEGSQAAAKNGLVSVSGGTELQISGTIYAPAAKVVLNGNSATNTVGDRCPDVGNTHVAAVQIISWQWDIGGTGDLCMPYDPSKLVKLRGQGLVH